MISTTRASFYLSTVTLLCDGLFYCIDLRVRRLAPRFGFICDMHRKQLSKKEQQAARDAWNAKRKA